MRVAVIGKGGVGKSVIAATLARVVARRGTPVLALDADPLPGLSLSLGSGPDPVVPPLAAAVAQDEHGQWGWRPGIDAAIAAARFSTLAPDGVRLLQRGKVGPAGRAPVAGAGKAFWEVGQGLAGAEAFRGWALIGDMPAGLRETADDWAPYADTYLVIVLPTVQSAMTARRVARLARARNPQSILFIASRVERAADVQHVERLLGEPVFASVPADDAVRVAERLGIATIDHAPDSATVVAIGELAARLAAAGVDAR